VASFKDRIRRAKIQREAEGYLELGLGRNAISVLGRLGDPTDFDGRSLHLWGEALRTLERYDEALVPLERAAQEDPEDLHVAIALGWCYKRTDQLDRAINTLERVMDYHPDQALLHYNLACYWSLARNKSAALEYLAEALRIDSDYAQLVDGETDFDPIRFDPEFQALCSRSGARG
jgi:tetratricopeptide (TPR) repeat protein